MGAFGRSGGEFVLKHSADVDYIEVAKETLMCLYSVC